MGLKFLSKEDLLNRNNTPAVEVDLDEVLSGVKPVQEVPIGDSTHLELKHRIMEQVFASPNFDSTTGKWTFSTKRGIQLPEKNPDALLAFFNALMNESGEKVVRVLHYGDSQLEGDRITDYLRNRLQHLFGGKGPGFVLPLEPAATGRRTARVTQSANFKKHAIYKPGSKVEKRYYGIGGASFEIRGFTSNITAYDTAFVDSLDAQDSLIRRDTVVTPLFDTVPQSTAYLLVRNANRSYERVRNYNRVRFIYAAEDPFGVTVTSDTSRKEFFFEGAKGVGYAEWNLPTYKRLKMEFTNGRFPLFLGLALDGDTGVAVDNFPMRGSAALGFSSMNQSAYAQQLKRMNVRLIILQYGVNVIPSVQSDYSYYRRSLTKELKAIRAAHPDASVLVIGPSDMSRNKGGEYVSYSNIPLIRDAMRDAAFANGCAFWDLYQAMGGENAMVSWVENGYAGKDYTHFSSKGARFVGEMLFEALMEQMQASGQLN